MVSVIDYSLYVITTNLGEPGKSHIDIAREAISGGATVIQLRDKASSSRMMLEQAWEIKKLTEEAKIHFVVNDRIDIALAVGADGVHLGQDDIPLSIARKILGKEKIIGITATNLKEAMEAEQEGADYLGVSPIFATPSKEDAGEPIGVEELARIRKHVNIPIVAIGGIMKDNIVQVIAAGADGVAVISAVAGATDMREASKELLRRIRQHNH